MDKYFQFSSMQDFYNYAKNYDSKDAVMYIIERSNLCVQLEPWWRAYIEDEFGVVACNGRSPVYCFERLKEMGVSWARMQNVIFTLILSDGSVGGTENFKWARYIYDFEPY